MKKRIINFVTVVLAVVMVITTVATCMQVSSLRSEVEQLKADKTITRVVKVGINGEASSLTLSLTPQGWWDFIRTYDEPEAVISNLDFEELFEFEPVEFEWAPEVEEFLQKEKVTFSSWSSETKYDGDMHCGDFVVYYDEYRDGIEFLFKNEEAGLEVVTELRGAMHVKLVYNFIGGGQYNFDSLYYIVFEDEEGNVRAINKEWQMFLIKPIQ